MGCAKSVLCQTRLISIVSNPFKVVVVVFFKKKFWKNIVWSKQNNVQKDRGQKVLDPKKNWIKEYKPKKFKSEKNVVKRLRLKKTI